MSEENQSKRRGRPRKDYSEAARPEMRGDMRGSSMADAERRAQEIMGNIDDAVSGTSDFIAPKAPDGWTYEWKRHTVLNQEDPAYQTALARTGWEPVPSERHPTMMPSGYKGNMIERKGMILMQRPQVVTDRFRDKERVAARNQIRAKEEQLGASSPGQFDRDHAQARPRINKSYEPIPIPEE